MNSLIVQVEDIYKSHPVSDGFVHALRGISLKIFEGEFLSIMGPSGSGKSTLLNVLGCLDTPTSGRYYLSGQDISLMNDKELSKVRAAQIGFVFQSYNLIPELSVYENLEVPFLYQNPHVDEEDKQKRILYAIDQVGLGHRLSHRPTQLSGGEAQRAAIARALAVQPLLLLADEPTGNLDRKTGQSILEMLRDLNKKGTTIVMVTHDEDASSYCKRMIKMEDGCFHVDA
jgi:putative ABC transport system ATP-binding protein